MEFVRIDKNWSAIPDMLKKADSVGSLIPIIRETMEAIKSDAYQKTWPTKRGLVKLLLKKAQRQPVLSTVSAAAYLFLSSVRSTISPCVLQISEYSKTFPDRFSMPMQVDSG